MTDQINEEFESFEVQGFTPYAQIPKWVLRSGKKLSHGAKALYGVIMTYADNETRAAFPGKEKLAEDMGASVRSIFNYMKELEDFGALKVTRRRNKKTGNYYANHYTLVFNDPSATECRRPSAEECPRSKPTILNIDPPLVTSSNKFDDRIKESVTGEQVRPATKANNPEGINSTGLTKKQRDPMRNQLVKIGHLMKGGASFYDDVVQDEWYDFGRMVEEAFPDEFDTTGLADIIDNQKASVDAKCVDPLVAGKRLTSIINTGLAM